MADAIELTSWRRISATLFTLFALPFLYGFLVLSLLYRFFTHLLTGWTTVPVTGVDVFFAQGLKAGNGMINTISFLDGEADVKVWREEIKKRMVMTTEKGDPTKKRFPQLSRRLSFWMGFPVFWRSHVQVDIDRHVFEVEDSPIESEAELEAVVNECFNKTLANDAPLWEMIIIRFKPGWRQPYYEDEVVPRSCVLIRCHHCYADGVSLVRMASEVLSNDTQGLQDALEAMVRGSRISSQRRRPTGSALLAKVTLLLTWGVLIPYVTIKNIVECDRNVLNPRGGYLSRGRKFYCWSRPLPLAKVKGIKNAVGGATTVNDVIMSCVGGALRRWMEGLKPAVVDSIRVPQHVKICMPVNLQPLNKPVSMNNSMLLMTSRVLTGVEDPLERLVATKRMMDATKESPLSWMAENAAQRLSTYSFIAPVVTRFMENWGPSLVYSNVPGPPLPIDHLGQRMLQVAALVPHGCSMGLTISFMSYCDKIVVSVVMDADISEDMEEARRLVRYVESEMDVLEKRVQNLLQASG